MKPVKKQRLSEMVVDAIREMIREKAMQPGDKLPSENELTKELQVSRSSVREAIRILEVTGMLQVEQGKGIFIADPLKRAFDGIHSWYENNEESLCEQFEIRLLIEPHACELAAKKADDKTKSKLHLAYEKFRLAYEENNIQQMIKTDSELHHLIAKATRNRTLEIIMETMAKVLTEGWITSLHTPGRIESTLSEHKAIIDAIDAGDAAAARDAMAVHLQKALQEIKDFHTNKTPRGDGDTA